MNITTGARVWIWTGAVVIALVIFVCSILYAKHELKKHTLPIAWAQHHASYFSQPEFFVQSFARVTAQPKPNQDVRALVVNHHLLAPDYIADALSVVATTTPVRVVLISPNHFGAGNGKVITSSYNWTTPFGELPADLPAIHELRQAGLVSVEEQPFEAEHGISTIIPFIKHALPHAHVVPIILKSSISAEQANTLATYLHTAFSGPTLVIASVDFSHYLPSNVADFHDELSIDTLLHLADTQTDRLEVDSQAALRLLTKYAQLEKATHFVLQHHSNSAKVTNQPGLMETTSYVTGYFSQSDTYPDPVEVWSGLFTGPVLGSEQAFTSGTPSFAFASSQRLFFGSTHTIATQDGGAAQALALDRLGFNLLKGKGATGSDFIFGSGPLSIWLVRANKNSNSMQADVARLTSSGSTVFVLVGGEWSEKEQKKAQSFAHTLALAGARAVLFTETKQQQAVEWFGHTFIAYGLGALDTNSQNGDARLALGFVQRPQQLTIYMFPYGIEKGAMRLLEKKQSDILLTKLSSGAGAGPDWFRTALATGIINVPLSYGRTVTKPPSH